MASLVVKIPLRNAGDTVVDQTVSSGFTNGDVVTGCAPRRFDNTHVNAISRAPVGDEGRFGGNAAFTAMAAWSATLITADGTLDAAPSTNWLR
jgi:hypothetical protein